MNHNYNRLAVDEDTLKRMLGVEDGEDIQKKLAEMAVQADQTIENGLRNGLVGGTRNERRLMKKLAKKVKR